MATSDYWSSADLKGVLAGGLINEDVLQKIFDISSIPLPFTNLIGSGSVQNEYFEWTSDELGAPDTSNAAVDGEDNAKQLTNNGLRVGNHCQISTKGISVTERADASDTIGRSSELAYAVMMENKRLRRDVEAIISGNQGSVQDDGDLVPGRTGAFDAWLTSNTDNGATGADGGFNTTTRLVESPTNGTARALSFALFKDVLQQVWEFGGDPSVAMGTPAVIRLVSEYMFGSTAQIATLQSSQEGKGESPLTAQGAVNVFVSDFGLTVELQANRLQETTATNVSSLYFIDPAHAKLCFLKGYNVKPLAKTGLADKRQISVDYGLQVNEKAHGVIRDIDETAAMVA
jgi:hypothetical protein